MFMRGKSERNDGGEKKRYSDDLSISLQRAEKLEEEELDRTLSEMMSFWVKALIIGLIVAVFLVLFGIVTFSNRVLKGNDSVGGYVEQYDSRRVSEPEDVQESSRAMNSDTPLSYYQQQRRNSEVSD